MCVQDERNQVLTTYLWIRQVWHDAYLKWDKEEYDNLEMINIPSDLVWKPDIVLYNKSVTSTTDRCDIGNKERKNKLSMRGRYRQSERCVECNIYFPLDVHAGRMRSRQVHPVLM